LICNVVTWIPPKGAPVMGENESPIHPCYGKPGSLE